MLGKAKKLGIPVLDRWESAAFLTSQSSAN
jgi:hypothetical protein